MSEGALFFDHVHLISQAPQTTAQWYVDNLGGRITASVTASGAPQVMVAFDGAVLIVRGQRPGEAPAAKAGLQWGTDHFGFNVRGDFDAYCDQLRRKGVVFTLDPVDYGPKLRIAFIQAPDGVSIELLQRK